MLGTGDLFRPFLDQRGSGWISRTYRRGIDAQMFPIDDKGIGYLKAEGQVARTVR